ncbi:GNAT family N-acetyltransferase [Chromobacterium vaccinii]|uniref:GNAT family N-acetyltransferase n=1 Tax=Chromobacterium vaccinii TaxID=1108595 RepID=UPI001E3C5E8B|nr:GNAT family N-acetyltransferase [Chromobacterium vaccinii]MCD4499798.1 GNAT family N-acetyltransferase [Chromobacterium vaccinii]
MSIAIDASAPADHPDMPRLWERSARASHHFLGEDDIAEIRSEVIAAFEAAAFIGLALRVARNEEGCVAGFAGTMDGKLEMLFIDPASRGRGWGRALLEHAVDALSASRVDVNEDNPEALAFYRRMGFEVRGRSARDGAGRPFPLLQLERRPR